MADGPIDLQAEFRKKATPAHFATYATSDLPEDSPGRFHVYKHTALMNQWLVEAATSEERSFINMSVSVRMGKQTRCDEPVLTTEGWSTIGELKVGDYVFGPEGDARAVVAVGGVDRMAPKMRVTFTDRTFVDVHPRHEWTLTVGGRTNTFETQHLAHRVLGDEALGQWRYKLPTRFPLQRPEANLPVPPYTLGVWLGDGKTSGPTLSLGAEDDDGIMLRLMVDGVKPSSSWGHAGTDVKYHYLPILDGLRLAGVLGNKHIPDSYMVASQRQRRELLQGLVDTDGHVGPDGRVRYSSRSLTLAQDVCALARTLGHRATMWTITDNRQPHPVTFQDGSTHLVKTAGVDYYVGWTPHDGEPQGCLARKQVIRDRPPDRVAIKSITEAPAADGRCIQVAHLDGLFLVGRDLIPTHNSFLTSTYFPVWYLGMYPDRDVVIISYSEDKAKEWGQQTLDLMKRWGPELWGIQVDPSNASKTSWGILGRKGGLRAVGIGGAIIGRGIHLGILDDPIKGWEEAMSPTQRENAWLWYSGQVRSRLMPASTLVLVMSRWHEEDIAGRIVRQQIEQPDGDPWRTLLLPAIAECPNGEDPETWRDQLGRREGEALWPERWPVKDLLQIKASITPQAWEGQYQQNPTPPEGGMFKTEKWMTTPAPPQLATLRMARVWDLASTDGGGDWTVGVLMGIDSESRVYVLDVKRVQRDSAGVKALVKATASQDGRNVIIGIEREKAGAGKAQLQDYTRLLMGYRVEEIKPEGSKVQRAGPFASQQQTGNVWLCGPDMRWHQAWIEEFRRFDRGRHDDQVDAASGAFNLLADAGTTTIITPGEWADDQRGEPGGYEFLADADLDTLVSMGLGSGGMGFTIGGG